MTLEQKVKQIIGFWQGEDGDVVAPLQGEVAQTGNIDEAIDNGLGHLTRVYGTNPHDPQERRAWLWKLQQRIQDATPHRIPALVHEECLTGLAAWKAATFPTPLAWGAAADPELVEEMGRLIGDSMRVIGAHQGLAPVLDVIRDPRWGRVDECIAEDPYLVGTLGTAYVRGMQGAGVHATLKHFVGYSASKAGRNFAPVSMGRRELQDVMLIPFEMGVKDGNVRSVMQAYTDIDGMPVAASKEILTGILRDQWGFDGVVVADYFGVAFLKILHDIAPDLGKAAALALEAGVDIELPTGDAYLGPLMEAVRAGDVDEAFVDRALLRALQQKEDLGLLDADFSELPTDPIDLDSPAHREVALKLAEKSVVLLSNDGILPMAPDAWVGKKVAVVGPNAHRSQALFGCYSFANHVLAQRPGVEMGFEAPTLADAMREHSGADISYAQGCDVRNMDASDIPAAVKLASESDAVVAVVGDHASLFGRGTVGEGCDVENLELPGVQRQLVEALLDTGKPVVLVMFTGRPYAVDWALERCAAVIQSFFPGEEGGNAVARILSGQTNPSGKMPISLPRSGGAQPYTYLHAPLGGHGDVSSADPTPIRPFGFGLSYTTFAYSDLTVPASVPTDGAIKASVKVANTGSVAGEHIVQLYARVRHASVNRPVAQLVAYTRVDLAPGASATVEFAVPTTRIAFSNLEFERVVEARNVELWVGDAQDRGAQAATTLEGATWAVTGEAPRWSVPSVTY